MNTIKRFLLLLAVSISLAGCGKENEESLWQETSEVEHTQILETDLAESLQEEEPYYVFEGENGDTYISLEFYFDEATGCGYGREHTIWISQSAEEPQISLEDFEVRNAYEELWEERDYHKLETYVDKYAPEDLIGIWDGEEPREIKESVQYDEAGRMTSYLATGEITEFSEDGDMMLLKFDYEYRDEGSLARRVYAKSSLVFGGTWFSAVTSLFDEAERVVYEDAYVTHGYYEKFYIYENDNRIPKYILNIDHCPELDVTVERCRVPSLSDKTFQKVEGDWLWADDYNLKCYKADENYNMVSIDFGNLHGDITNKENPDSMWEVMGWNVMETRGGYYTDQDLVSYTDNSLVFKRQDYRYTITWIDENTIEVERIYDVGNPECTPEVERAVKSEVVDTN